MATKHATTKKPNASQNPSTGTGAGDERPLACNQALVIGELVTEPDFRTVTGGVEVLSFSLTVRQDGVRTTSVPLVWYDPPERTRSWQVGMHIVATGPVVRRFYHAKGAVAARTEVNVSHADPLTRKASARRMVTAMSASVGSALDALD